MISGLLTPLYSVNLGLRVSFSVYLFSCNVSQAGRLILIKNALKLLEEV